MIPMKTLSRLAVAMFGFVIMPLFAGSLMPDLSLAPTGWQVDRYAPASFTNRSSVNGQNNVLGLRIDSSTDYAQRPSGFQYTFYNTQGEGTPINGGPGDD